MKRTPGVDDEDLGRGDADGEVADLVGVSVAKPGVEGIVLGREQRADVLSSAQARTSKEAISGEEARSLAVLHVVKGQGKGRANEQVVQTEIKPRPWQSQDGGLHEQSDRMKQKIEKSGMNYTFLLRTNSTYKPMLTPAFGRARTVGRTKQSDRMNRMRREKVDKRTAAALLHPRIYPGAGTPWPQGRDCAWGCTRLEAADLELVRPPQHLRHPS